MKCSWIRCSSLGSVCNLFNNVKSKISFPNQEDTDSEGKILSRQAKIVCKLFYMEWLW